MAKIPKMSKVSNDRRKNARVQMWALGFENGHKEGYTKGWLSCQQGYLTAMSKSGLTSAQRDAVIDLVRAGINQAVSLS